MATEEEKEAGERMQEELCRKEFGFDLPDLKKRVRSLAQAMEEKLYSFCTQALTSSTNPSQRRELGSTLLTDMATISKLVSDHLASTVINMQFTLFRNMQAEHNKAMLAASLSSQTLQILHKILSRITSDIAFLRSHRASMESKRLKHDIVRVESAKDKLRQKFEESEASLAAEVASLTDVQVKLKATVQRLELEKASVEAEAMSRFEDEKALLEDSIRKDVQACQICLVHPRNVVILPCFHGQYCEDCMGKANKSCPTCRSAIKGTLPYIA